MELLRADADVAKRRFTPIIGGSETLLQRGIDLLERNRFEEAAELLGQAAELTPDSATAFLALGIAQGRLLRIPEAMFALERAVELDPRGFYPRYRLGELYLRVGVPTQAREELQRALDLSVDEGQRRMVRKMLAADLQREAKRAWRPDFSRLRKWRS
ncbi:MAG: tetratricopeptide repeat protein [Candidatus Binataceae bacterium]|nr:tetratricopeptide repeat protein [Candidatus Binataceae bacterium]